jgi:hypothetical protein
MSLDLNYLLNHFNTLSLKESVQLKNVIQKINWKQILPNLKLNEEVLDMFADQLDWNDVVRHQYISDEFYARHKHRLDK